MQLLSLEVWNILGCRHGFLDLSDKAVPIIGGGNFQGKSSFLTAFKMVLGGQTKDTFPKQPITAGEDEGRIVLKLQPEEGDTDIPWPCCVVRTLVRDDSKKGYATKVEIIEGHDEDDEEAQRSPSPQSLLDELVSGGLNFDPLKFVHYGDTEQANTLRQLVGLDFTAMDAERAKLYQRRTGVNKEVSIVDGQIRGLDLPDSVPSERVDVGELTAQLKTAHDHNAGIEAMAKQMEVFKDRIRIGAQELRTLQDKIDAFTAQMEEDREKAAVLDTELEATEPRGTTDIEQQIEQAASVNELIDRQQQALKLREQRKERRQASKELSKKIEAIDAKKKTMMAEADWPIPGLGFSDTGSGVVLNDTPFSSLSAAEKRRCAAAISIRKNPHFPVTIIWDGSLLDMEGKVDLTKTMVDLKGTCFLEVVTEPENEHECHLLFKRGYGLDPDEIDISAEAKADTSE